MIKTNKKNCLDQGRYTKGSENKTNCNNNNYAARCRQQSQRNPCAVRHNVIAVTVYSHTYVHK